ncbi:hypothetical protein MPSEU_001081600 [Mayamaea pseudoterrestris]|nr:hypothetical protein MPSEU_001081600 [Mayamaea pseudoterrestris]
MMSSSIKSKSIAPVTSNSMMNETPTTSKSTSRNSKASTTRVDCSIIIKSKQQIKGQQIKNKQVATTTSKSRRSPLAMKKPLLWLPSFPLPRSRQNSIDEETLTDISKNVERRLQNKVTVESATLQNMASTFKSCSAKAPVNEQRKPSLSFLPTELLYEVLVFAGPQAASNISQTNQNFNNQIQGDALWKVMGEAYGKWTPEQVEPLTTWKELYFSHPLVPVDFSTIQMAMKFADCTASVDAVAPSRKQLQSPRNITILLQSGTHSVNESIHIDANVEVTIAAVDASSSAKGTPPRVVSNAGAIRFNQPLFHVTQGTLVLQGLDLCHESHGADLWNGNAAVFVRPREPTNEQMHQQDGHTDGEASLRSDAGPASEFNSVVAATVMLQQCSVQSKSGRGVSVMGDNSVADIRDCLVHNCAATGVYLAGSTAKITICQTDIIGNGQGNVRGSGVRRGHSGLYLEAGCVSMNACSVARNTATGISIVAGATNQLLIINSHVSHNERAAIEVPLAEVAQHVLDRNNQISVGSLIPTIRSSVLRRAPELLHEEKEVTFAADQITLIDFLRAEHLL